MTDKNIDHWFNSEPRKELSAAIFKIPAWKRVLICLRHYRSWKMALTYSLVARHAFNELDDWHLFSLAAKRSDEIWARIFSLENDSV